MLTELRLRDSRKRCVLQLDVGIELLLYSSQLKRFKHLPGCFLCKAFTFRRPCQIMLERVYKQREVCLGFPSGP